LSEKAFKVVTDAGVQFAEAEDAGHCLLRILADTEINGKSLFLSPKKWASVGFLDLDVDDYPGNELLQEIQADQIKSAPVFAGLFLS